MNIRMKWLPVVTEELCDGCKLCVDACGPACLEVIENVAVLTRPDRCGSEEHCIAPCPSGAIRMAWVETTGDESTGRWRSSFFSQCQPWITTNDLF